MTLRITGGGRSGTRRVPAESYQRAASINACAWRSMGLRCRRSIGRPSKQTSRRFGGSSKGASIRMSMAACATRTTVGAAIDPRTTSTRGDPALWLAARAGNARAMRVLLERGAPPDLRGCGVR
jgi:hypothetical protein